MDTEDAEEMLPKVVEFYDYLRGVSVPDGFCLTKNRPKLSCKKAFQIIYVLQEGLHVLPDTIELCQNCYDLFNSESEGYYLDDQYRLGKRVLPKKYWGHWCNGCAPDVDFYLA